MELLFILIISRGKHSSENYETQDYLINENRTYCEFLKVQSESDCILHKTFND